MDIILFEFAPPILLLIVAGVIDYYYLKVIYNMIEYSKKSYKLTDVVLVIFAVLVLSILMILQTALVIEAIV
jgi:predicted PurR-regulated permease PerM